MSFLLEHLQAKPEMIPCNCPGRTAFETFGVVITSVARFMANSRLSAIHF